MRRLLVRITDIGIVLLPLVIFAGLVAAYLTLVGLREIVPPRTLTIAAGREGGGYHRYATAYAEILARDGITLRVLDTAGSRENAEIMAADAADVALIQGGVPVDRDAGLEALGAVFLEPFFIFHKTDLPVAADPASWVGLRIAAGEPGSGTRVAFDRLMQILDVRLSQGRVLPLGGADAVEALRSDAADVAIFVAPIDAPYLDGFLTDPGIAIGSLRDAKALSRRVRFVHSVDIPAAGLDYARRIPPQEVPLTATVATLAAQRDLHPALVNRMVRAAQEVHSGPVLLSGQMAFPNATLAGLPMNPQARAALTEEIGLFEQYLPYWLAAQITRVTVLIVPLLVLLVPLLRALPGLYAWRMRSRVYRYYARLNAIDTEAGAGIGDDRRRALLDELQAIEADARRLEVPVRYREMAYTLRFHIDQVRQRIAGAGA